MAAEGNTFNKKEAIDHTQDSRLDTQPVTNLDDGRDDVANAAEKAEQAVSSTGDKFKEDSFSTLYLGVKDVLGAEVKSEDVRSAFDSTKDFEEFAKKLNITKPEDKKHVEIYYNWLLTIADKATTAKQEVATIKSDYDKEREQATLTSELYRAERGEATAIAHLDDMLDTYVDANPTLRDYKGEYESTLNDMRMSLAIVAKYRNDLGLAQRYYREALSATLQIFTKGLDKKQEAAEIKKTLERYKLMHKGFAEQAMKQDNMNRTGKMKDFSETLDAMKAQLKGGALQDKDIIGFYNKISEGAQSLVGEIVESEVDEREKKKETYETRVNTGYTEFLKDVALFNSPDFKKNYNEVLAAANGGNSELINNAVALAAELGVYGVEDLPANIRAMIVPEKANLTPDTAKIYFALAILSAALTVGALVLTQQYLAAALIGTGMAASIALGDIPLPGMETLSRVDIAEFKLFMDLKYFAEQAKAETDPEKKKALVVKIQNIVDVISHKRAADLEWYVKDMQRFSKDNMVDGLAEAFKLPHERRDMLIEKLGKEKEAAFARNPEAVKTYTRYEEVRALLLSSMTKEEDKPKLNEEAKKLRDTLMEMGLGAFVATEVKGQMTARTIEYHTEENVNAMLKNLEQLTPSEAAKVKEHLAKSNNTAETVKYLGTLALTYAQTAIDELNRLDPNAKLVFDEAKKSATPKEQIDYAVTLMTQLKGLIDTIPDSKNEIDTFFDSMLIEAQDKKDEGYPEVFNAINSSNDSAALGEIMKDFVRAKLGRKYLDSNFLRSLPLIGLFVWGTYKREMSADMAMQQRLQRPELLSKDDFKRMVAEVYALDKNKLTEEVSQQLNTSSEKSRQKQKLTLLSRNFEAFQEYAGSAQKEAEGHERILSTEYKNLTAEQMQFADAINDVYSVVETLRTNINQVFDDRKPIALESKVLRIYYAARQFIETYDPRKFAGKDIAALQKAMQEDKKQLSVLIDDAKALLNKAQNAKTPAQRDALDNQSLLTDKFETGNEFTINEKKRENVKEYINVKDSYMAMMANINKQAARIQSVNATSANLGDKTFFSPDMFLNRDELKRTQFYYGDRSDNGLATDTQMYRTMLKEATIFQTLLSKLGTKTDRASIRRDLQNMGLSLYSNRDSNRLSMNLPLAREQDITKAFREAIGADGSVENKRLSGMVNSALLLVEHNNANKDDFLEEVRTVLGQVDNIRSRFNNKKELIGNDPELAKVALLSKVNLSELMMNLTAYRATGKERMVNLAIPQGERLRGVYAPVPEGSTIYRGNIRVELEGQFIMLEVTMRQGCANVQIPQAELIKTTKGILRNLPLKPVGGKVDMPRIPGVEIEEMIDNIVETGDAGGLFMLMRENIGVIPAQTWTWLAILITILIPPVTPPTGGDKGGIPGTPPGNPDTPGMTPAPTPNPTPNPNPTPTPVQGAKGSTGGINASTGTL